MKFVNFERFLKVAQEHAELIIALCAEQGLISRSMLLNYLEHQHIVPGEEASLAADQHVSPALGLAIGSEVVGVDALIGLGVVAVPAQDVAARAADQDLAQQIGQPPLARLDKRS